MENFTKFLTDYGIGGLLIIVIAFGLTQIIKAPIKKKAEAWANKNGVDKSVITKWLFVLPFVLAFIGSIINVWALGGWGRYVLSPEFDWTAVITETLACSGLAGSIFGIGLLPETCNMLLFILPPGAFITLGYLIAIVNKFKKA